MSSTPKSDAPTKQQLRRLVRNRRKALSPYQRKQAALSLSKQLLNSGLINKSRRIAVYLANDGEIDPNTFIEKLSKTRCRVYLPTLHPLSKTKMVFCEATKRTKFTKNRFGISEPSFKWSKRIHAKHLSLVLLPLVAFDKKGNRMGMGGGFYDRTFAFKQNHNSKPDLIGLAYELQKVEKLPVEPWDIPLAGIITEKEFYKLKK